MMRSSFVHKAAAAAAGGGMTATSSDHKMASLHKLLTGEVQFRNNALLKTCNIEHNFGATWKSDIEAYAKCLPADERSCLERQVARVMLTRYTTRELAEYCGEGPEHVDAVAREANIAQAKAHAQQYGADKLEAYVKAESKNAGWSEAETKSFLDAVKAAK
ncbi:conserved hypothetical protein [Leishmania major strain Friedlin]|uniref:Uncharacterized protein n=1 Tax=Leishmania major TaxID=5664 RepID=Q4Q0W8_LEIMA|nr:conserved hypothetical protein [Leishmania major strain Friedlin]CAG9583993.1 hypothetical_protein_-_conserved [Leishmania major strain Friedlin]CAJ09413.1 conserved hypothetical protein [Leishmania major strain Friedlin]|eukprot:XP_001687030.1 conserved hypothetical protein [Leishmania major strain Friedlin]